MNLEKLAGCLIINDEKVLLVKEKKDWYWKIPSGKLEENETSRNCAIRETKEEANVDVKITKLFGSYKYNFKNRNFKITIYKAEITNGNPHITEPHLESIKWFPIEYLNVQNTTPSNKFIYEKLNQQRGVS